MNVLHVAAEQDGTLEILKQMIESNKFDFKFPDKKKGNTALHYSFQKGILSNAKYLLSLDTYKETWLNSEGHSPLYFAVTNAHYEFIKDIVKDCDENMLLSCIQDFDPNRPFFPRDVESVTVPLVFYLLCKNYEDKIRELLQNLLLKQCIHPDIKEVKDSYGNSILHYLTMCPFHKQLIEIFNHVSKKIDVNVANKGSATPLHYACSRSSSWMLFYLFKDSKNNAIKSLNMKSSIGLPGHIISSGSDVNRFLLAHGAKSTFGLKSVVCNKTNKPMPFGIIVLGNSMVGKTTLIRTLKMMITNNRQLEVKNVPTTGIVTEEFIYYKNGHRFIFFDFAGQVEFETSHSRLLRDLLSSAHGKKDQFAFLLLVKGTDTIEDNKSQIKRWISFLKSHVRINSTTVHVVLICTHDDKFNSDEEQEQRKNNLTDYFKNCAADPLVKHEHPIFMNGTKADTSPVSQVINHVWFWS